MQARNPAVGRITSLEPEMLMRRCTAVALAFTTVALFAPGLAFAQGRRVINPPGLPTNLPYTNGIQVDDMLFISGMQGKAAEDITAQTRMALLGLKSVVETAGFTMRDVAQVTVYLKDLNDFAKMNAVYQEFFPNPKPVRTTVEVVRIANDVRIEIMSLAVRAHGRGTQ
jgi:2-iminobutanoate/2-iminopropanoate deaminase